MSFRDLRGSTARGEAFSGPIKPFIPTTFRVVEPATSKRTVVVLPTGAPPVRRWASREERARALVASQPARRSTVTDAAALLVETVRARTGAELEVVDEGRVTDPSLADANLIHVGVNGVVRDLLRPHWRWARPELLARVPIPSPGQPFTPEWAPDGDGFILLALRDPGRARDHLIILGGVGFGTCFGVVHLLARHAGARWLWPGPLGTVIPRSPSLAIERDVPGEPLNVYDEPDYRGRSLDALSAPVQSLAAIDAVRDWALNNRLHPADERVYLFNRIRDEQPHDPVLCSAPIPWPTRWFNRKETRVPVPHALHDMLSPFEVEPDGRIRFQAHPEFYPDIRPRVSFRGADPVTNASDALRLPLPPELGRPVGADRLAPSDEVIPTGDGCAAQGFEALPGEVPRRLTALAIRDVTPPIPTDQRTALTAPGRPYAPDVMGARVKVFGRVVDGPRDGTQRFIPLSRASTIHQLHQPIGANWKFCVYAMDGVPGGAPGRLAPVRADLATQLAAACVGQVSALSAAPTREAVVSLLPNDEGNWCQCDACALSVSESNGAVGGQVLAEAGAATQWRMHKGVVLFAAEQTDPGGGATVTLSGVSVPNFGHLDRNTFEGVATPWVVPTALRASFGRDRLSPDDLAAQGILRTGRQSDVFSRRYVDLVNAIVARFVPPPDAGATEVWFSMAAYSDWRGAPITEANAREAMDAEGVTLRDETRLADNVIAFVTGVRDLTEYEPTQRWTGRPLYDWHSSPERFNFVRWSLVAGVTGVYEYLLDGTFYLAPRLYSRRLGAALTFSHRSRARAFVGEATPAWALDGPKWFELASQLWNLGDSPGARRTAAIDPEALAECRREYCRALCTVTEGAASPAPDEALVRRLVAFFNAVESTWCDLVDRSLEGYRGSWELGLRTLVQQLRQLDGLDAPGVGGFSRAVTLVEEINAIHRDALRGSPDVAARVGFLRSGWRVLDVVARASRAVRYLRRYLGARRISALEVRDPAFIPTWTTDPRWGPPTPTRDLLREALVQVNAWFEDTSLFQRQVREALNDRLVEVGLLERSGAQLLWRQGDASSVEAAQFMVDCRGLSSYVDRWNSPAATRFDLGDEQSVDRAGGLLGILVGDIKREALRIAQAARNFDPADASDPFQPLLDVGWMDALRRGDRDNDFRQRA